MTITVEGMKEIQRALKGLEDKVQTRVIKSGLRAGGREVVKAARRKLPSEYGTLKRSLGTKILRPSGGGVGLLVGARTTATTKKGKRKRPKNDGFYAHIVEFGTLGSRTESLSPETSRKSSWSRKDRDKDQKRRGTPTGLKARPFLRPAFKESQQKIVDAFVKQVGREVERQIAKARK